MFLCLLVLVAGAAPVARAADYSWRSVAIGGGGFVSGVIYHPTAADLVYARTDVGGAYRWDAAAAAWIPLNDDLGRDDAQLTGVVSLAVDPSDPERLYLACGQYLPSWGRLGAILRSNDRGATWQRTELTVRLGGNADGRSTGERLVVDPHDGRVLWLGTNQDGLWRSADRGVTWTRMAGLSATQLTLVELDQRGSGATPTTVWVGAVGAGSPLYRSTDNGATWTAIPGLPTGFVPHHAAFDYRDAAGVRLYVAGGDGLGPNGVNTGSVWKLDPATGTAVQLPVPTGQGGFGGVSVDPQRGGVVLVSTIDRWWPGDEVFRTTDGGATWKPLLAGATFTRTAGPWTTASTPHWTGDVDIDPHHPDRAMFITGYGVWATDNLSAADTGGVVTWDFRDRGLDETVPLEVISPAAGAPLIAAYGDIGVFRHLDLNQAPGAAERASPGTGTAPSVAVAGAAPLVLARTHYEGNRGSYSLDGGVTWTGFAAAPAPALANGPGRITVTADGARFVWMPTNAGVYVSTDRGTTWTAAAGAPTGSFKPVADAVSGDHVYVYDPNAGRVAVSTNGGATFAPSPAVVPAGGGELKAAPGHAGHVWLPGGSGGLYRSTNYGASFTAVGGFTAAWRMGLGRAADGADYPALYVWGRRGAVDGLWRSADTAASWTRINDDAHQFGWLNDVSGDARVWGRVYLATGGRGVVVGELAEGLPPYGWTVFTPGAAGTYAPPVDAPGELGPWSLTGVLPGWATLDPVTGQLSGVSTDEPGTTRQFTLRAGATGATMQVNLLTARAGHDAGLANLAARSPVQDTQSPLVTGFVIYGEAVRPILLRGAGPALGQFGLDGFLAKPELVLRQGQQVLARNAAWSSGTESAATLRGVMQRVGAFAWIDGSRDTALLQPLPGGIYTAEIDGLEGASGVALVEAYDASNPVSASLANLSVRARAGTGADILIGGLTINGGGGVRLLVRAVGPGLDDFGLTDTLDDPVLRVMRGSNELARNDNWSARPSEARAARAAAQVAGAFPLGEGSGDAALVIELVEGGYTLQVAGADDGTGVALLEIYVLP